MLYLIVFRAYVHIEYLSTCASIVVLVQSCVRLTSWRTKTRTHLIVMTASKCRKLHISRNFYTVQCESLENISLTTHFINVIGPHQFFIDRISWYFSVDLIQMLHCELNKITDSRWRRLMYFWISELSLQWTVNHILFIIEHFNAFLLQQYPAFS